MLQHANLLCTAWDEEELVGIARSITDFEYCCYLSDLAVDKEYQKKGIGKKLVELTRSKLGRSAKLVLSWRHLWPNLIIRKLVLSPIGQRGFCRCKVKGGSRIKQLHLLHGLDAQTFKTLLQNARGQIAQCQPESRVAASSAFSTGQFSKKRMKWPASS